MGKSPLIPWEGIIPTIQLEKLRHRAVTCPGHSLVRDQEIRVETPSWPSTLALPGSWITLSASLTANNQYSHGTFSELLVWLL